MIRRGSRRPGSSGRRRTRLARTLTATAAAAATLGLTVGGALATGAATATGPTPYAATSQAPASPSPAVAPAKDVALIVLQTMTPTVVRPGTDVTITGTVTAPLTGPLSTPDLHVVRGDVKVIKRGALDDWAAGRTPTSGRTVATTRLPTVAAGQTRTFTATVPWERLRSDEPFEALPVSVELVQQGASAPIGMTRTFVAWNSRKEYVPLKVATLVPVTLDPDIELFSRDDPTREAAWQRAIGAGSRVGRILEGTRGKPVDLAVDPSVLGPEATTDPAGPPRTPSGTGTTGTPSATTTPTTSGAPSGATSEATSGTVPGATSPGPSGTPPAGEPTEQPTEQPTGQPTGQPSDAALAIGRLRDDVAAQLRGRSVWALPYADADVAATVGTDPANSLVRDLVSRAATLTTRLGQPARADIMWPVDGLLPAGRERGIRTLLSGTTVKKPAGIVVSSAAVTKATAYTPTARRVAASGTRLLAYDTRLSALLPRRTDPSPVLSVQRYLAESLVLLGERAGTPRSVLVVAPRGYDPDAAGLAAFLTAVSSAPWLDTVAAASMLGNSGDDVAQPQTKPTTVVASAAPRPVLNPRRLTQLADQRDTLVSVSSVLRDGAAFERTYRGVLDELASARWRYRPGSWGTLATSVANDVRSATSAIKVASRATVNLLAEKGILQVTIENGLDYTVQGIRLRLAPNNPRIQVVEQPGPIAIGPSSRTNVPVQVAAVAAGRAEIRAFLTTADGTQIGSPATISVSANPLDGTIYWVGGILVGLVLLFGVVRAIVKGTSRVDEIADIEAVTAAHEALGDSEDRDRR